MLVKSTLVVETVRKLLSHGAPHNALHILNRLHPWEVADLLSELTYYRRTAFELLARENLPLASEVLSELGPSRGGELLAGLSIQEVSRVLGELDPDDAAEFVGGFPQDVRQEILNVMGHKDIAKVKSLLQYTEKTAGRIMSPNVFALGEDTTVDEAISRLRESEHLEMVFYIYVVDDRNHLVGVLSLRQLIQRRPGLRLKDIMEPNVIRVQTSANQEEVARLVASYNLLAVPVVDPGNGLVGFIPVDDVIDVIEEEATEDIYRLAGLDVSERVSSSSLKSVRMRFPWLALNLGTAFLAASVVGFFEKTIARYAFLAVFMPVVAGMGGNAGTQTLTLMVRGIALDELRWSNSRKVILKELSVGAMNGVGIGLAVSLSAYLWKGNVVLGLILALAMAGNMLVAAAAGTLVPLGLRWLKVDPALASSVFVTTCTDVFGFLLFLGMGALLLGRL